MQDSHLPPVPVHAENVNEDRLAVEQGHEFVSGLHSKLLVKFGGVDAVKPHLHGLFPALGNYADGVAISDGDNLHLKPERQGYP